MARDRGLCIASLGRVAALFEADVAPPVLAASSPTPESVVLGVPRQPDVPAEGAGEALSSVATWYGADYHGRFMACLPAERYDMNDPTITASTWYPCNTWLRVCHEGRCIEVVVRDTGLFDWAVDLSRAAFASLAPLGAGVIPVTVEMLEVPE